MVGYTTYGSNDLARAVEFYDALLVGFGAGQIMSSERMVVYGKEFGNGLFAICEPFDKGVATSGNGVMVAFNMESQENVRKLHAKALELGATSEGEPGARGANAYAAYFRDLDGNKICGFCLDA